MLRDGADTIAVGFVNLDLNYHSNGCYDEMLAAEGRPRPAYRRLYEQLNRLGRDELQRRHALAMEMFRKHGITFAVYPDAQGTEKVFPFDVIPRVVEARTWQRLEEGLKQRLRALNLFLEDIYGRKLILKQRAIPPEIVLSSSLYLREIEDLPAPHGIHCHIAGIDLVRHAKGDFFVLEGSDLVVDEDHVFMRTTRGLRQVDVIYRRIDDEWLDPIFGRQESLVGVAGLINAYRVGNVAIANALGNGVADDKAIYALVPAIVRYYLDEDPILPNVETYLCSVEADRRYDVEHLEDLVVKTVDPSGRYGMLIGPVSTQVERDEFRRRIEAEPRAFVAQPVVALSVQPIFDGGGLRPGHQDLRPFVLTGPDVYVTPGGLTRVALKPGSLVVNSSQGGGSRDTWVMAEDGYEADAQ